MRVCSICGAKAVARSLCRRHYVQAYRKGLPPLETDGRTRPLKDRLLEKVDKQTSECWLFTGGVNQQGYGEIWHQGGGVLAHRVSYRLFCGELAEDEVVCHRCDVRNCINPEHLFKGTRADNNRDKVEKGGQPRGETHANSKLSEADVTRIIALRGGMTDTAIAKMFGVHQTTVSRIFSGRRWAHRTP